MKRNIKGFRLNRNGKPIITEQGEVYHDDYKGASYKDNGMYYFFLRTQQGKFVYKP